MAGAWYVGIARWRRHWRRLIFLGILAGVIGGAVLGAVAGARRSSSAYDRLFESAGSPHEVLFLFSPAPELREWLKTAPGVDRVIPAAGMLGRSDQAKDWYSVYAPVDRSPFPGRRIERGRVPGNRADEVFITLRTSRNTGLDVGDELSFRAYDATQVDKVLEDPWLAPAGQDVKVKIVGVARDPSDAQLSQSIKLVFGTPEFAQKYGTASTITPVLVWLKGGRAAEPAFEEHLAAFARTLRPQPQLDVTPSRDDANAADHSSNPVVIGLLIFASVAAIAGLVAMVQAVRRSMAPSDDEGLVLRALGAGHGERALGQFVANLPYLVIGTLVAVAISYAVSPIFPIGATRTLEPASGLHADPLVLVAGGAAWFAVLGAVTFVVAWIDSGRRNRAARSAGRRSRTGELGSAANGSPTTVGVRFGLQPGVRRSAVHRSALVGVVIAVIGVVSCVVFATSVDDFIHTPPRYGIDYDLSMELPNTQASKVLTDLTANRDLEAVAGLHTGAVDVEGRRVDASGLESRKGSIQPTLRAGSLPAHDDEVALGPKLLSGLHKRIGDTVTINKADKQYKVKIVGTALSPALGSSAFNEEALFTANGHDLYSTDVRTIGALLRVRPGANVATVTAALDDSYPYGVSDESPASPPGPVSNLQQITRLPLVLALFFAFLGAAAVAQSIFMTAAERRRDLAVLRVIGYTRRQFGAVLRGAASGVVIVALALGVPAGILAGKFGWRAVANSLAVTPAVDIPLAALVGISLGLLAFGVLVALIPAHLALRRAPGSALRTE